MSIKTTKTNAHQQRAMPKPLRKGGLHSIEDTGAIYAHAYASSTPQPLASYRAAEQRTSAALQAAAHRTPVRNSTVDHKRHPYLGHEFSPSVRPGAMDAYSLPSLRVWPGGEPC